MHLYADALSIAVNVIGAYADETGIPPGWWEVNIYRMFNSPGWLVSATQSTIIPDKWISEKVAV